LDSTAGLKRDWSCTGKAEGRSESCNGSKLHNEN
jgi:hypothetical protein